MYAKKSTSLLRFGASVSTQNPTTMVHGVLPGIGRELNIEDLT